MPDRMVLATSILGILYSQGVFRNCTECHYWNIDKEECNKFKQRPPVKVIVKGCSEFEDNEIPF